MLGTGLRIGKREMEIMSKRELRGLVAVIAPVDVYTT